MNPDRHMIWRLVANNYRALEAAAPDGYEPAVEVFLVGRSEPIRLAVVHTMREPAFPWTLFVAATEGDGTSSSPDENLVFVPEQYIERVELRFAPLKGRRVGFAHELLEDASSPP